MRTQIPRPLSPGPLQPTDQAGTSESIAAPVTPSDTTSAPVLRRKKRTRSDDLERLGGSLPVRRPSGASASTDTGPVTGRSNAVNMSRLSVSLVELQADLNAAKNRYIDLASIVEVVKTVRHSMPRQPDAGHPPNNHKELIAGISKEAEAKWFKAMGLEEVDVAALRSAAFRSGLLNPIGGYPGVVLSYIATPLIAAAVGDKPWVGVAAGIGSAAVSPALNAWFQSPNVTRSDILRERGGPTVVLPKGSVHDKNTLHGIAEELSSKIQAFDLACSALAAHAPHPQPDGALASASNEEARQGLQLAVLASFKEMADLQETALMTHGSHGRQQVGNENQIIPRTARPLGAGAVGFGVISRQTEPQASSIAPGLPPSRALAEAVDFATSSPSSDAPSARPSSPPTSHPSTPPSSAPSSAPSSGATSLSPTGQPSAQENPSLAEQPAALSGFTTAAVQSAIAAAVTLGHHFAAARDEENKQIYQNKLNMLHADVFTPGGKEKFQRGEVLGASDIDRLKVVGLFKTPAQSFIARVDAEVAREMKEIDASVKKALGDGHTQQVTDPESDTPREVAWHQRDYSNLPDAHLMDRDRYNQLKSDSDCLKRGNLTILAEEGTARRLIDNSLSRPLFTELSRSALRIKAETKGEFAAQATQRYGQAFHMGVFGSAAASIVTRVVNFAMGGGANATVAQVVATSMAGAALGFLGAKYQFAAISAKNYRREQPDKVSVSQQLLLGVGAMPLEIMGARQVNQQVEAASNAYEMHSQTVADAMRAVAARHES